MAQGASRATVASKSSDTHQQLSPSFALTRRAAGRLSAGCWRRGGKGLLVGRRISRSQWPPLSPASLPAYQRLLTPGSPTGSRYLPQQQELTPVPARSHTRSRLPILLSRLGILPSRFAFLPSRLAVLLCRLALPPCRFLGLLPRLGLLPSRLPFLPCRMPISPCGFRGVLCRLGVLPCRSPFLPSRFTALLCRFWRGNCA
jgi:hypothetical protein